MTLTKRMKANLIILASVLIFIAFMVSVEQILLPFILAFVLAYILHPAVVRLERRHVGRGIATTVVVTGFCLGVVAVVLIVVPLLQTQIFDFIGRVPAFSAIIWNKIKDVILYTQENVSPAQMARLSDAVSQTVFSVFNAVGTGLTRILSSGIAVFNVLSLLLITPVVLFYVLRDWQEVQMRVKGLVPKDKEEDVLSIWQEINGTLSGFIRGQSLVCVLLGIFYATGLSFVGLEFGILIGFIAGILSFIPYFGFGTGLLLSLFLGLVQGLTWGQWAGMAGVFVFGQLLESYILTPYLVGNRVGLGPVWVIFALLAGGVLFGFLGILLAVPVAAVIGVLLRRGLAWYRTTSFYTGKK